tara:strand:+ start:12577 stop:12705 length:129 start_codon:yes stop_codon:yes gene_type:complete
MTIKELQQSIRSMTAALQGYTLRHWEEAQSTLLNIKIDPGKI